MKRGKKILCTLLAVLLLAGCLPMGASAEETNEIYSENIIEQREETFTQLKAVSRTVTGIEQKENDANNSVRINRSASLLVEYINRYGALDVEGDLYIDIPYDVDGLYSITRIYYLPDTPELLFLGVHYLDGAEASSAMGYNLQTENANEQLMMASFTTDYGSMTKGECRSFNIRTYTKETELYFKVTQNDDGISPTLFQNMCNEITQLSVITWEMSLLKSGLGVSLYDMGFVSYFPGLLPTPDPDPNPNPDPGLPSFTDVKNSEYFYDAVQWAVEKGITSGTDKTHFSPNQSCTRAQAVTFLWRAAGLPEPAGTGTAFTDVKAGAYYEKAVQWAVEQGITAGTGDGKFSPEAVCTRAQIVTFLHRAEKSPEASGGSAFSDVKAGEYYEKAVKWAVEQGITAGTGNGKFSPNERCTRGQIVTFLYRCYN